MPASCSTNEKDLAGRRMAALLIWGLPTAALIASAFLSPRSYLLVWPPALLWMGLACLINALRCGRVHCYFTGPFFLLLAAASLLHGLEIVPLGPRGWTWLGVTLLAGGAILSFLPEWLWGRYSRP